MSTQARDDDELPEGMRRVIDEVRSVSPRVDWSRVEASLFDDAGAVRDIAQKRRAPLAAICAALAMAASFALALSAPTSRPSEPVAARVPPQRAPLVDVASHRVLKVGDAVDGGDQGSIVRSEGRLEAHFAPHARAHLVDDGERVRFALDFGSIAAEVTPVSGGEPFAVDVGPRRVAVHGTKLMIARFDGALEVAVSEGSAVVGASYGDGRTEGVIVPGGSVARFAVGPTVVRDPALADRLVLDLLAPPKLGALELPSIPAPTSTNAAPQLTAEPIAPTPTVTTLGKSVTTAPTTTASAVESVEPPTPTTTNTTTITTNTVAPPPPPGLSDAQVAPVVNKLVASLQGCAPKTGLTIKATVQSTMTLSIAPNGSVADASFNDPPLDTPVRACVMALVRKASFPVAEGPTTVTRTIVLGKN